MFTQSSKPSSTPTKHSGFVAPNGPRKPTCSYCERTNTTHTIEQCRDRLNGLPRGGGNRRRSGSYKPDTNGSPSDEGRPAERKGAANLVVTTDNLFFTLTCDEHGLNHRTESLHAIETTQRTKALPLPVLVQSACTVSLHGRAPELVPDNISWVIDSGASQHYCNRREWFDTFEPVNGRQVSLGDGHRLTTLGQGSIRVAVPVSQTQSAPGIFSNVQYVPDLAVNLLSVPAMIESGLEVRFKGNECIIRNQQGVVIGRARKVANKLYLLIVSKQRARVPQTERALVVAAPKPISDELAHLWHARLAHLHHEAVRQLLTNGMVADDETSLRRAHMAKLPSPPTPSVCEPCAKGKSHREAQNTTPAERAMAPLALVHTDLCGPFRTAGVDGSLYFISVIDDSTRIIWGRVLQAKSEVFASFRAYKAWAETQHPGHRLQRVRMDGGANTLQGAFLRWLDQQGIVVERTAPYTPAQNGVAERENRTLLEAMRAMMLAANLPPQYWPEALRTAIHIRNRSPTRALFNVTPYELWWRKKPNIGHLRAYGCLAYAHIPKQHQQGKLAERASKCILIGYSADSRTYRLLDCARRTIITSANVRFDESCIGLRNVEAQGGHGSDRATFPAILVPYLQDDSDDQPVSSASAADPVQVGPPPSEKQDSSEMPALIPPPPVLPPSHGPAPEAAPRPQPTFLQTVRSHMAQAPTGSTTQPPQRQPRELRRLQDYLQTGDKYHAPSTLPRIDALLAVRTVQPSQRADPTTVQEALSGPHSEDWMAGIRAELGALVGMQRGRSCIVSCCSVSPTASRGPGERQRVRVPEGQLRCHRVVCSTDHVVYAVTSHSCCGWCEFLSCPVPWGYSVYFQQIMRPG